MDINTTVEYCIEQGDKLMEAADQPNISTLDRDYFTRRAQVYYQRAGLIIVMNPVKRSGLSEVFGEQH